MEERPFVHFMIAVAVFKLSFFTLHTVVLMAWQVSKFIPYMVFFCTPAFLKLDYISSRPSTSFPYCLSFFFPFLLYHQLSLPNLQLFSVTLGCKVSGTGCCMHFYSLFLNSNSFQRRCYKVSNRSTKIVRKTLFQSVNIFLISAFTVDFLEAYNAVAWKFAGTFKVSNAAVFLVYASRHVSVNHPPTTAERKTAS